MRLWNFGACVLALLVVSCGGEVTTLEQQEAGTLRLPLTASSPDGKHYRLVGATFTINGPQPLTLTDTSSETVTTPLMAGAYTLQLVDGWHLEDMAAPGTAVPSQLLSPNPLPFFVTKGELTQLRFHFKLPGSGAADVGISVDDGGWLAGTLHFTEYEGGLEESPFKALVGKSVPFLISFPTATLTREGSWSKTLRVQTGPITVQFGGAPSELLERAASSMKDASLSFELRAEGPSGFISFGGMFLMGPPGAFELELQPTPYFPGSVDSEGYPAVRSFQFETTAYLNDGNSPERVRGEASVNGSP